MSEQGVLLFNLVQNWENEVPQYAGRIVIELSREFRGYSFSDEYGNTDFMPNVYMAEPGATTWFIAADQDTIDAFIGAKKIVDGITFCQVVLSVSSDTTHNLNYMIGERYGREALNDVIESA
jgi:hypothetical protein